ncbi:MAG: hypothetical protein ACRDV9_04690 [Acidimicrobiia bacterium]
MTGRTSAAVVIPIRAFAGGKSRLAGLLAPTTRSDLLALLAGQVAAAAAGFPTAVVSSAPEVLVWASQRGLATIADPGSLNAAAAAAQRWATSLGVERVVIAHADLPLARSLAALTADGPERMVAAVRCHRADGTPVLSLPTTLPFRFAYGRGSFARHVLEAAHQGAAFRRIGDPCLEVDVDGPGDLWLAAQASPVVREFLLSRSIHLAHPTRTPLDAVPTPP